MTNYSTNIGGFEGGFQSVSSVQPSNRKAEKQSAFLDLASKFAGGALKGASKKAGRESAGVNLSNAEVESSVGLFDDEVAIAQRASKREAGRELTEGELADIRNESMEGLELSTREIKQLVAQDRIRSVEANARIKSLMAERMANPFLAVYEKEFTNTVAEYTGDVGISPTEKDNALRAAAAEKAKVEFYELAAQNEVAGMSTEQAKNQAVDQLRFNKDNDFANAEIKNGNLTDVPRIQKTFGDNVVRFYNDFSKNFLQNESFKDPKTGRLNVDGLQSAKAALAAWTQDQYGMIGTSKLQGADLADARSKIDSVSKTLATLADEDSLNTYYKAAKELGVNATDAMFLQSWPMVHTLMRNGLPDVAKTMFYGGKKGSKGDSILRGMGLDATKLRETWSNGFFDPNIAQWNNTVPTRPEDVSTEGEAILTAIAQGDEDKLREIVADDPEKKAYVKRMSDFAARHTVEVGASDANTLAASKGDEGKLKSFQTTYGLFARTLTSLADIDGDLGEVYIEEGKAGRRFKGQPDNYPAKVSWSQAKHPSLKEKRDQVGKAYAQIYKMHKWNPELVPDPIAAMNTYLDTGKMVFPKQEETKEK